MKNDIKFRDYLLSLEKECLNETQEAMMLSGANEIDNNYGSGNSRCTNSDSSCGSTINNRRCFNSGKEGCSIGINDRKCVNSKVSGCDSAINSGRCRTKKDKQIKGI